MSDKTLFFSFGGEIKKAQGDLSSFSSLLELFKNKFLNSEQVQQCVSATKVSFYIKDQKFDVSHKLEDMDDVYDGAVLEVRFPAAKREDATLEELERLKKKINMLEEKDRTENENPVKKRRKTYVLQPDALVVRIRGLPWGTVDQDVIDFFETEKIAEDGIFIMSNWQGKATGEAYVQFDTQEDLNSALERNKQNMRNRYIEVFPSDGAELYRARCPPDPSPLVLHEDTAILKMRGLPYTAVEADVRNFFDGIPLDQVHMTKDVRGRSSGEAYVECLNDDDREKAMEFQKRLMSTRYIELFRVNRVDCEMPKFFV